MPVQKQKKKENEYQGELIKRIQAKLPEADILKNDPNYKQGIPDLSILYGRKYAYLEVKASKDEPHQPNQDYYVEKNNRLGGYARFIYPENENEILPEMIEYLTK